MGTLRGEISNIAILAQQFNEFMTKHRTSFPVRYYECDAYNHVNHANYIRFMGEAAGSASAMVGYTRDTLMEMKRVWLTREHQIEFLTPLRVGDTVNIDTWVADFRRVRSLRRYDIYANDTLAARASTDWVFVDTETNKPITVSPDMEADFRAKNYVANTAPPRERFPKPPPQAEEVGNIELMVEWRDIDPNQHVNNAAYFSYIENGTLQMCSEHYDWPPTRMAADGFAIIARRYRLEYREPAVMGDTLLLKTWISDIKRATAVRHYEVSRLRDGAICARGRCLWVWVNINTHKPIRIPPHFLDSFEKNMTREEREKRERVESKG